VDHDLFLPPSNAYTSFFFYATGVTPAMNTRIVGEGSQYMGGFVDANRRRSRRRQNLQAAPAAEHSGQELLVGHRPRQPDPLDAADRPAVSEREQPDQGAQGQRRWFGRRLFRPERPAGEKQNWAQTVPGRSWDIILRLYGPLEAFFNKTWRPREIELEQ
jgi:hypothetical protein